MSRQLHIRKAAFPAIRRDARVVSIAVTLLGCHVGIGYGASGTTAPSAFGVAVTAYERRDFDAAATAFRGVLDSHPEATMEAKAAFNLGMCYKALHRYDDATAAFARVTTSSADNREPGGDLMQTYREYRPRSQMEIGHCLFLKGKFAEAMEAYRTAQTKYPGHDDQVQWQSEYLFRQGLCEDWLGHVPQAVNLHIQGIIGQTGGRIESHLRTFELYMEAGQRDRLIRLLDAMDAKFVAEMASKGLPVSQKHGKKLIDLRPSMAIRRLLQIRDMEAAKDWNGLTALLKAPDANPPTKPSARVRNFQAVEAARLLALHPDETVPLLIQRLEESMRRTRPDPDAVDGKWVLYALGGCATPEAIAVLKAQAAKDDNYYWQSTAVYALSLAGEKAKLALDELAGNSKTRGTVASLRAGLIGNDTYYEEIKFPKHEKIPQLPDALPPENSDVKQQGKR